MEKVNSKKDPALTPSPRRVGRDTRAEVGQRNTNLIQSERSGLLHFQDECRAHDYARSAPGFSNTITNPDAGCRARGSKSRTIVRWQKMVKIMRDLIHIIRRRFSRHLSRCVRAAVRFPAMYGSTYFPSTLVLEIARQVETGMMPGRSKSSTE